MYPLRMIPAAWGRSRSLAVLNGFFNPAKPQYVLVRDWQLEFARFRNPHHPSAWGLGDADF